jgi:hypothetical protein
MLILLQIQIGIPYFYGGLAKLNGDWLRGEPMGLWLSKVRVPLGGSWTEEAWAAYLFSYGGLLLDLLVVPLLLWRRTRVFALAAAVGFHLMNSRMFHIDIFPWFMIAATVLVFFPDWFAYGHRWKSAQNPAGPIYEAPRGSLSTRQRRICVLGGLYVAVQLVLPFRHYLYRGDASWTEEGGHFAWRMMLRDKQAFDPTLSVSAVRPDGSPFRDRIELWRVLPQWQLSKVVCTPEMIAEFAQMIAKRLEAEGFREVDIRAHIALSLNGREPQAIIDPEVNLARVDLDPWPKPWIVPLTQPFQRKVDLIPEIR